MLGDEREDGTRQFGAGCYLREEDPASGVTFCPLRITPLALRES